MLWPIIIGIALVILIAGAAVAFVVNLIRAYGRAKPAQSEAKLLLEAAAPIRELDGAVGAKQIRAIHFNDSRASFYSRIDRHWHIGQGYIGRDALRRVARHRKLAHAAFILETPYDTPQDNRPNIEALRSFLAAD